MDIATSMSPPPIWIWLSENEARSYFWGDSHVCSNCTVWFALHNAQQLHHPTIGIWIWGERKWAISGGTLMCAATPNIWIGAEWKSAGWKRKWLWCVQQLHHRTIFSEIGRSCCSTISPKHYITILDNSGAGDGRFYVSPDVVPVIKHRLHNKSRD